MPANPLADVAQDAMLRLSKAVKELEVGDRVTYDGRPGTVQGVGCEHCSSVVVKDDGDGRLYMPGSPYKLKRFMKHMDGVMEEAVAKSRAAEDFGLSGISDALITSMRNEWQAVEDERTAAKLLSAFEPVNVPNSHA